MIACCFGVSRLFFPLSSSMKIISYNYFHNSGALYKMSSLKKMLVIHFWNYWKLCGVFFFPLKKSRSANMVMFRLINIYWALTPHQAQSTWRMRCPRPQWTGENGVSPFIQKRSSPWLAQVARLRSCPCLLLHHLFPLLTFETLTRSLKNTKQRFATTHCYLNSGGIRNNSKLSLSL